MPTLTHWIMIAAVVVALGVGIYNHIEKSPDFSISVDPMQGQVEKGGVIQTTITIESINRYEKDVSLSSSGQSSGITTSFSRPFGGASPAYTSNLMINVAQSVPVDTYKIEIKGQGADGKSHSTYYTLYVMPESNLVSNTTPTQGSESFYVSDLFSPSGLMGDFNDISFDDSYIENPYSEPTCTKITYIPSGSQGWTGIYWQYPENNWGDNPEGRNLSGETKVTFFARGEKGGELAEFKVGGITDKKYKDSIKNPISTEVIVLSKEWRQYTIDLTGQNLEHVIGGFCWVTSKSDNPSGCTIYLDDIVYE